jgi:hypothetical protein
VATTRRFAGLDPSTWPGSRFDWAFSVLATLLVAAGYYDAWIDRHLKPQAWAHAPSQGAWLLVTVFLAGTALARWLRERRPDSILPDGYLLSALGCAIFAVGVLSGIWWQDVYGPEIPGVPAIFRPSNLIQIAASGLIVTGPLRAAVGRGELVAGPTALISATLLLATITFFSQWDHPYVNPWATDLHSLPANPYAFIGQELGALGLMMQAAIVTATILMLLRQIRLPRGSITVMLTATAFLVCTQLGHFQYVGVAAVVGVLSDLVLYWAQPSSGRLTQLRVFAAVTGGLLAAVYLVEVSLWEGGTYWGQDVVFGSILTCGLIGWLVSYFTFPNREVAKAAAVLWPPLDQDSSPSAPDITVERLEHALKVFNNLRDLAESPLVYMRCLPTHSASSLRLVMEEAISSLRASGSQVDAQAGEILDLYYVHHIGGHYAVERRVGLSRAAYFNRRSYGVRRLVDRLKELEEQATPA